MVAMFPKLAGLQAEYIDKQLRDFLSGKRKNDAMTPFLANIKAGDIAGLAAYYAAQKPLPGKVEDAALAAKGKLVFDDGNTGSGVPACVGCHQPGAAGNERYPRLAGQHQAYTADQMRKFKTGARNNDRAKVMRAVAERMTEEEIVAVSEYLAGLP
jgi:cytochrome c553